MSVVFAVATRAAALALADGLNITEKDVAATDLAACITLVKRTTRLGPKCLPKLLAGKFNPDREEEFMAIILAANDVTTKT